MTDVSASPRIQSTAWKIASWIVMALLTAAMVLLVPQHEPWFDEAHAWLLARDASWWEIVWKYARYEGSPSLWHTLLLLPAKAGLPPVTLNAISGALALIGAALLLFKSPLPPALRLLLPCGFFFFYQYGLVARSYALLMPLLWLTALAYPRRFERPWRFVGMLIVTSQVSLHAAWIAGILMAVFTVEARWSRRLPMKPWSVLVLAFAVNTAFIAAQLWPAPDAYSPPQGPAVTPARVCTEMSLDAISPWPVFSAVVLIGLLLFFYTRGVLLSCLLVSAGLVSLFAFKFFSIWHSGLIFAVLILHFWLAWVSPARRRIGATPEDLWPKLASGLLALAAAFHVWWAVVAGWNDWKHPYSGSREAAAYLQERGIDRERIHIFKFSTCAVLLYLDHNPFANVAPYMPGSFWVWTREAFAGQTPAAIVQGNPPWILVGTQLRPAVDPNPPPLPGYTMVRLFPGRIIWKDDFYRTDSYYLYQRNAPELSR
jgi:hypothetical protein